MLIFPYNIFLESILWSPLDVGTAGHLEIFLAPPQGQLRGSGDKDTVKGNRGVGTVSCRGTTFGRSGQLRRGAHDPIRRDSVGQGLHCMVLLNAWTGLKHQVEVDTLGPCLVLRLGRVGLRSYTNNNTMAGQV